MTAPAWVQLSQAREDSAALTIVIHEGRNRQVRRMFETVGHPVRRLIRTRIGPLADRGLKPGEWRTLHSADVRALYTATGTEPDPTDTEPGPGDAEPDGGNEPDGLETTQYPRPA